MGLEQEINYQLNRYPKIKKVIKNLYQHIMYAVSPKVKSEGNITRVSPDDAEHEYFFGYYDKSPWDISDRYMLCIKAQNTWSDVSPREKADILIIDTEADMNDPKRVIKVGETRAWNVQQACMLQWLGPDYQSRIIYNDYREGKYCSVILNLKTKQERVIWAPVYTVSSDGKFALTLDFSRLYNLRPGYGYYNVPEHTQGVNLPDTPAIWKVDLKTGKVMELFKYTDFAYYQPRPEMKSQWAVHKVNHLMLNPSNNRFMVLYRWFIGTRKYTRLITCNVDGSDMFVLSDDDMVSHCFWKNDKQIIAFENKKEEGVGYYLMDDMTKHYYHCWPEMKDDGHPSFSPNGKLIVTDTYPNRERISCLKIMDGDVRKGNIDIVAKVFSPFKYDNNTRCDLHPRWNHASNKICFDAVFEGHRGMYVVNVSKLKGASVRMKTDNVAEIESENSIVPKYSIVTPLFNSFSLMERYFDSLEKQTYKNFEVIIVDDCSTDDSYKKACQYARKTVMQMSVFKTEKNMGPGNARNVGMDVAKGEWITFIDSDDWVETNMFEKINAVIEKENTNCVIYDYYTTNGKKRNIARSMYSAEKGYVSINKCIADVRNHTIGKVYKREKLEEKRIRYPKQRRCEDVAFVCRAIEVCGSVYYMNEPLYYYFLRASSLSNNSQLDEKDMINAFSILENTLGEKYPAELKEKSVCDLLYGVLLMMCKAGKSNKEIKTYISNYEKKYSNWWKCDCIRHIGSCKKLFLIVAKFKQPFIMKLYAILHGIMIE